MKCDKCNNEANFEIHFIGNENKTISLCKDCYAKYIGSLMPNGKSGNDDFKYFQEILTDLIGSILNTKMEQSKDLVQQGKNNENLDNSDKKCSNCGTSLSEIITSGKFGCSQCYEDFKEEVGDILIKNQGAKEHKGKVPEEYKAVVLIKEEIEEKEEKLKNLIVNEDYETAAIIRDEIKKLKLNLENSNGDIDG